MIAKFALRIKRLAFFFICEIFYLNNFKDKNFNVQ